ncbi:MAG: nitrite/sulfite reductase [Nitrososphaerales archaeon]
MAEILLKTETLKTCPQGNATLEKALKVNPRERLKAKKECPLDVINDLVEMAKKGYEKVQEEDFVLLKWWGVIHEKPKTGKFSIRIGVPGGRLTPDQLRKAGELAMKYGDGFMKITARQGLHIFRVGLGYVKHCMDELAASGLKLAGGCGDAPRNITTCPLAGLSREELFDPWGTISLFVKRFVGNRAYSNLPHKFKVSIGTCPYHCNLPEINDVGLIGVEKDGRFGFTPLIGGSTSLPARIARHLPVFLDQGEEAVDFIEGYMNTWQENPRYRMSYARARSKFLVDDCPMETIRKSVESWMGHELEDFWETLHLGPENYHLGVGNQKQPWLHYVGFPIPSGMLKGEQAVKIANLAESVGADLRTTVQGNLVFVNLRKEEVFRVIKSMEEMGFKIHVSKIRSRSYGCTGDPYCGFSLGLGISAREEIEEIVTHLEKTIGDEDITILASDCPHACSRTWLGDIGIEGTSRLMPDGNRVQAFHILLGGGRRLGGTSPARLILRRVLPKETKRCVERIIKAYLEKRNNGETFKDFWWGYDVEELKKLMLGD